MKGFTIVPLPAGLVTAGLTVSGCAGRGLQPAAIVPNSVGPGGAALKSALRFSE